MIVPQLAPTTSVVFALDRTGSMHTRDCPEGMSRWDYMLGAVREAMNELCRSQRRVSLLTFGNGTRLFLDCVPQVLDGLTYGDAQCNLVDAAITAAQVTSAASSQAPGHVVLITDGVPDGDTPAGLLVASNESAMHALFQRVQFLTVGKRSAELESFARKWPNNGTLESLLHRAAAHYGTAEPAAMSESVAEARDALAEQPARSKSKRK